MMRLLASIAMIVLAGTNWVSAQNGFIVHMDSVQDGNPSSSSSVFEVPAGYLLFDHQTSHDGTNRTHIFVRKLDPQGHVVHEREYTTGEPRDYFLGVIDPVARLDTGGFACVVLVGSDFQAESWLYRFNEEGDTTDRKFLFSYDASDSITYFLRQTRQTADGGFIAAGFFDLPQAKTQALALRLTPQGDTLWTRRYGQPEHSNGAKGCAEYVDGGYLLIGYRLMSFVNDDQFLIRTDSAGNQIWRRQFGDDASGVHAVRVAPDSTIITAGEYREDSWPNYWQQAMFTKWNAAGSIVWQKKSHYHYETAPYDFEVLPDGAFVACIRINAGLTHIAKFSSNGDSLWSRAYTVFIDSHYPRAISLTSDGGFISTGFVYQDANGPHPNLQTTYVIKTDSLGCVVPGCQNVGVGEYEISLQEHLSIWPSPATENVRVELELPEGYALSGAVRAVLLDASGRQVLQENVRLTGNSLSHSFTLSTSPGLYYLHLADEKRWLAGGKVVIE